MSDESGIEWTDKTWNPSTGCTKVSEGCKFCYAETMAERLHAMDNERYENEFEFTLHRDKIGEPKTWSPGKRVFVNSMSDLFHPESPLDFLREVFGVMMEADQHWYQVLTKRPQRMADVLRRFCEEGIYQPTPHIWLGTSVESGRVDDRVDQLRRVPAAVRFLSCEPLIGPIPNLDLDGIHWVIVGGESGNHLWTERTRERRALVDYENGDWQPREERVEWVREIRRTCSDQNVPFFFKQWGGATSKAAGRELDGRTWNEFPTMNPNTNRVPAE